MRVLTWSAAKPWSKCSEIMRPGTKIVSIAAVQSHQTAIKDLGGRRALSAAFWIMSYSTRSRARRARSAIVIFFMHPSGRDLAAPALRTDRTGKTEESPSTRHIRSREFRGSSLYRGRAKGKVVVRMS